MHLPPDLQATRKLEPGVVVCHKNAVGLESFGIVVSEVDGTYQVAYPSRLRRRVLVVPLEEFAPLKELGVPVAPELQAPNLLLAARRALAMKDQTLSLLGSNTAEFLSLCLHGHKEAHHTEKLQVTLGRVWLGAAALSVARNVSTAIGSRVRRARRR